MSRGLRFASVDSMPLVMRDAVLRQQAAAVPPTSPREPKPRRGKYNASPVHVDGIRFDSKREARYFERLRMQVAAGEIQRFHRQVIFDLEGGVIYKCDFQVTHNDNRIEYVDAKGVQTKEFRMKMRMVRARYGVEIVLV